MSGTKKRPLEDYFKPYGRTDNSSPHKRQSTSGSADENTIVVKVVKKEVPKTPVKTVTFKDVTPKSKRSLLFSPRSASLPIRSPGPTHVSSPTTHRQTKLLIDTDKSAPENVKPYLPFALFDSSDRSQKVFEDGKVVAVKDSDDDTESLESLDDIFGRRRDAAATSDSSPLEDTEAERVKSLNLFANGRSVPIVGKEKLRALYAKERATKFDLSAILDDHFGDEEAQQNILFMRAGLEGSKEVEEDGKLDRNLLASLVKTGDNEQDDIDRLLNAVDRTEALSADKKFSFFQPTGAASRISSKIDSLPESAIPQHLWASKDTKSRDRMYLSGYLSELASSDELNDELLSWTYRQLVNETRPELRQAYVQCLKASSKTWTRLNLPASDVSLLFRSLGAEEHCLEDKGSIRTKHQSLLDRPRSYGNLCSILHLFREISPDMDFLALSKLSSIVLRMTLDKSLMANSEVCRNVELLMERLLSLSEEGSRKHVFDCILNDAKQNLNEPHLQIQFLSHILPTSTNAITLQRCLANIFLLGPDTSTSEATVETLSTYVAQSSSFSITQHANSAAVDYSELTARTQILSIAISSGDIPESAISTNSSSGMTFTKQSLEELKFNTPIDDLADQLHNIFISIKDTGASHMRRTEAKDTLQALYFRLLFSVRTRPRKKRHVFDPSGEVKAGNQKARWLTGEEYRAKERSGQFMKKFFAIQATNEV